MKKNKPTELFEFFQDADELWHWRKKINGIDKGWSAFGFDSKQDCINDAIINGYQG